MQSKIISDIDFLLSSLNSERKTIVFTNGCFDLLHEGHLHLLREAKKLGDVLIIGINDDASVQRLKGTARPVESLKVRMDKLAELSGVDYIISFSEDTPLQLIEQLQPAVLVKGGDYKKADIIGKHIAQKTVIIPLLEGFSTTKIMEEKHKHKREL